MTRSSSGISRQAHFLVTMHNVESGYLWTAPPTENAPSGWLWTDRPDLISVVRCHEDGSNPKALADDDPDRLAYLAVHNQQKRVMDRLRLTPKEIDDAERALAEALQALKAGQMAREAPPQLGLGKQPEGGSDG